MKKLLIVFLLVVGFGCHRAHAGTCPIAAGSSASTIGSIISACGSGNTVTFAAGTYSTTYGWTVPCGVSVTGPAVATYPAWFTGGYTPTAILTTSTANMSFFYVGANCTTPMSFKYLWGKGAGFIQVGAGSTSNFTVEYNKLTSIPSGESCSDCESLVFFGGDSPANYVPYTLTNATIMYNYIGDSTSCTYVNNITSTDEQGYCAGVLISLLDVVNYVFEYNWTNYMEEGTHFINLDYNTGGPAYTANGLYVEYNLFQNTHRISAEIQPEMVNGGNPVVFEYNVGLNNFNTYFGTLNFSLPCCQFVDVYATNTTLVPAVLEENNILAMSVGPYSAPFGFEGPWGQGSTADNNLVQGYICNGFEYGYSSYPWHIDYNVIEGPNMPPGGCGGYISNERGTSSPPTMVGNKESPTVSALTSTAPTISPTPSGTYSAPITVTLTDAGLQPSGIGPQGNTTIYYTTDGSTPTVNSAVYTAPFSVAQGSTVNAIGMWGVPPLPTSYPSGYGFVPSAVVSAHYVSSGGGSPTLTGVSVSLTGGGSTLQVGNSAQAIATCSYSGGITTNCTTNDAYGTTAGTWASSVPADATIGTGGLISAVAAGSTNITVHAGSFTSPAFALTVAAPTPTLTGVTLSDGGVSSIAVGQTMQAAATATYSNGSTTNCTSTADSFGTTCGTWTSSTPADATISSSGLITGVAVGSTNLTVKATNGSTSFTSSPLALNITSATPPSATLTGVSISCATSSVQVGNTDVCAATCAYNLTAGGTTTTNCTTADAYGTTASGWASSVPADATVSTSGVATGVAAGATNLTVSAGSFTSPNYALTVVAAPPANAVLGNNQYNYAGVTYANYINATYAVTGSAAGGYATTGATCTFYLPTGYTYTAGSKWDCGLILAPSATTQATSWLCYATYTTLGTSADVGWHVLGLAGCGVLPASTAYWVAVNTNEAGPIGEGFWNCGSSCTATVPTSGNGTYYFHTISAPYGTYTGMGTAMNPTCTPGSSTCYQGSQYVTLSSPLPTLTGGYLGNPGPTTVLSVGGSVQFSVFCTYSDGSTTVCWSPSMATDQYGNTATAFASSNTAVCSIGNIGSAHPGLATGVSTGTCQYSATLTGGATTTMWNMSVSSTALPYPPSSAKALASR